MHRVQTSQHRVSSEFQRFLQGRLTGLFLVRQVFVGLWLAFSVVFFLFVIVRFFVFRLPVDATDGLSVVARVPRGVEDDDAVGADQVDAEAAGARRYQKQQHVLFPMNLDCSLCFFFFSFLFFCRRTSFSLIRKVSSHLNFQRV